MYLIVFFTAIALLGGDMAAHAQYPGFDSPGVRSNSGRAIGLVPVDNNIDGGSIPIGAAAQVVVLFRNDGAQPVQTGKINLYPSSNISASISLNQCENEPLPAGAECAVAISVKGLQSGAWRLEMLMLHSGRSRLVTATLFGSIDASGDSSDRLSSDIETIPSEIDFGSLATGQSVVQTVILRNITSNAINLSDIYVNASERSGYEVESECSSLVAGQACLATVTWSPKQKGTAMGTLVVEHSGSTGLTSVALLGDYVPDGVDEANIFPEAIPGLGLLVSSQAEIDFGSDVASASTITVSLVNTGDSKLTLSEIKVSGSNNGLSVSSGGCAADIVLEPVEACPLTLSWSPTRVGALLDDIQILHNGVRGVLILPVRGNAESTVSQDQKSIVLTKSVTHVIGSGGITSSPSKSEDTEGVVETKPAVKTSASKTTRRKPRERITPPPATNTVVNAISALDGLKITSFSSKRAIVNGPGGSRLIFDDEQIMLGGVVWDVLIQKNGIEFASGDDRVLLLFDRSLSSFSRVSSQSSNDSETEN